MPRPLIRIPGAPPLTCPACRAKIAWRQVAAPGFFCPQCRTGLHLSPLYLRVAYFVALVIAGLLGYAVGVRGEPLFVLVCLGGILGNFPVLFVSLRLFPPDLEPTGDFRGILHGDSPELPAPDQTSAALSQDAEPRQSAETVHVRGRKHRPKRLRERPLFRNMPEHYSIEGMAIFVGAVLLALFMAWQAIMPIASRIFPGLGAFR